MLSISNGLTLLRAPLAFLFLVENTSLRVTAIILAMITDSIDGYLARRRSTVTQFGAILDPAMDKFFVFFALMILMIEGKIEMWQTLAMISRDFFLCAFGIYLSLSGLWKTYECKSIRWGKATTALQFLALIAITLQVSLPGYFYCIFILFGLLAFVELFLELYQLRKRRSANP